MDEERRKDSDAKRGETPEGVRILGADEAAEALERRDVAHRRSADELRYGDRPPSPPADGPRPVLRFPLGSSDDPRDIERTPVASSRPDDPDDAGELPAEPGDRGEPEGAGPAQATPPEVSGPVELPHWTEPPTGQVPSLLGGDAPEGGDDAEDWTSFASATPRWRDDSSGYEAGDDDEGLAFLTDEEPKGGALDDSERPSHQDYLSFADVDDRVAPGRSVFADFDDAAAAEEDVAAAGWLGTEEEPLPPVAGESIPELEAEPPAPAPRRGPRPRRGPPPAGSGTEPTADRDMGLAVVVGVGLLALALFLFSVGPAAAMILVTAVVGLAAAELFTSLRQTGFQPVVLAGLVGTVGLVLGAYNYGTVAIPTVLVLTTAVCLLWYLVGAGAESPIMNIGVTLGVVLWVGLFGSFAALMLHLGDPGIGLLLAAILGTVGYDVGGFFVGRNAGRQPLSAVSPNKTVEGLLGGCVVAVVVVVVGAVAVGFGPIDTFAEGVLVGVAVALAAPLGDLCESLVKRDLGVKDMGSILPGHGGLLDRFDALLFVLPTVYLLASVRDFFV